MAIGSRDKGRRYKWVKTLFVVGLVIGLAWGGGLFAFASKMPERVVDPDVVSDAIIVLTGGSGRLREGLDLLLAGKADQLFVSGVYRGVDVKELLAVHKQRPDEIEDRISLGSAVDTIENASETANWMRARGFSSLTLVTASYHMPRSLLEFENAMPEIVISAHPVFPDHVKQSEWWAFPGTLLLTVTEYNKFLAAWVRMTGGNLWTRYMTAPDKTAQGS